MDVGVRSGLVAGKICAALLLGVVPIALVIPGRDVAWSQNTSAGNAPLYTAIDLNPNSSCTSAAYGVSRGQQVGTSNPRGHTEREPGGPAHALLWRTSAASVVDLHPGGFTSSYASGISGGEQVGGGSGPATGDHTHALLWHGSASTVLDLHPSAFVESRATGSSGEEQVGSGFGGDHTHALLWRGSAASVVDLHPSGFTDSEASGASGGEQVGHGSGPATAHHTHALLWHGSAASVVDLNPNGFIDSVASGTSGGEQVGYGYGALTVMNHALLWRGSAGGVVDLHPNGAGFFESYAVATSGGQQVGYGRGLPTGTAEHALLWRGSAVSVVDLHTFLPSGFSVSWATGIDATGDIVGFAIGGSGQHAFLWKRNAPTPGAPMGQGTMRCQGQP